MTQVCSIFLQDGVARCVAPNCEDRALDGPASGKMTPRASAYDLRILLYVMIAHNLCKLVNVVVYDSG